MKSLLKFEFDLADHIVEDKTNVPLQFVGDLFLGIENWHFFWVEFGVDGSEEGRYCLFM